MSTIRSALIRLAHINTELRPYLLPLLKSAVVSPSWQGLSSSLGKMYAFEAAGVETWYIPVSLTKSEGVRGWQVTHMNSGKLTKAVQKSIREQDLKHWKSVTAKDVYPEVLERFRDAGVKVASNDRLAAVAQPRSGKPVYEGNAMALPLDWGTSGEVNPDKVSQYLVPLYRAAKNGVAFVLDQRGVLTRAGLPKLARALESNLSNLFGEDAAMTSEYYEWATKSDPEYQNITSAWNRAKMAENIRVMITPVVSPATGKSGLKVSFSIPVEKLEAV